MQGPITNNASQTAAAFQWKGGPGLLAARGTWGSPGVTLSLEVCDVNSATAGDWMPLGGTGTDQIKLTDTGTINFFCPKGWWLRPKTSGGTGHSVSWGVGGVLGPAASD